MNVRLLAPAQAELIDAADSYEQRAVGLGARFHDALDELVANLTVQPQMYGRVSRVPRGRDVRLAPVGVFEYVAVYEVTAAEVIILSVTHARSVRQPWRRRLS